MTKRKLCLGVTGVLASGLCGGLISVPVLAEGPVDINIVEKVDDGSGGYKDWEDIVGAMPGMSYSAIPRVVNNGTMPVGVRMCLSESVKNAAGEETELQANVFDFDINERWVFEQENNDDQNTKRCYKYDTKLAVNAETEPLFTMVTLNSALENEYQGATFGLHIDAYAEGDEPTDSTETTTNSGKENLPNNPDTGGATKSEALTRPAAILLTVGAVTLVTMMALLLKKAAKKNKNKN